MSMMPKYARVKGEDRLVRVLAYYNPNVFIVRYVDGLERQVTRDQLVFGLPLVTASPLR